MYNVFSELEARGFIAQSTNMDKLRELLSEKKVTFYIGFDATADSLHVGHMLQLIVINHMIRAGHTPILLLGTGTTMVGDPTGKTDMRKMLSPEEINYNADKFIEQMGRLLPLEKCIIQKNGDWLTKITYIDMLRDVGIHFSVNRMLSAECFKSRLERGLSFIEFNYMIMQSYDFLKLNDTHDCVLQLGGDDQWSNIIGGVELVRRVKSKEVYGMTFKLLTTKDGKKMGKTEKGAVWLDPEKMPPYEFYQYWRNIDDADVINCMKLLTFIPIEKISEMEGWQGSELNTAKELLAYSITEFVHGKEHAEQAKHTAQALFAGGADDENMPTTTLLPEDFENGEIGILKLLVKLSLAPSNAEARRLIVQGGISIDGRKIENDKEALPMSLFSDGIVIKKGKKVYHRAKL